MKRCCLGAAKCSCAVTADYAACQGMRQGRCQFNPSPKLAVPITPLSV